MRRPKELRGTNRQEVKEGRTPALRGQSTGETVRAQSEQRGLSLRALNNTFLLFGRGRVLFAGTEMELRRVLLRRRRVERRVVWFWCGPVHLCAFSTARKQLVFKFDVVPHATGAAHESVAQIAASILRHSNALMGCEIPLMNPWFDDYAVAAAMNAPAANQAWKE